MDIVFTNWLLLTAIQAAATVTPGPAFAFSFHNAVINGRRAGIFAAMGLGLGVAVHVAFVSFGFAILLSQSVVLFSAVKYAGAAYLIYMGLNALGVRKPMRSEAGQTTSSGVVKGDFDALKSGLIVNLLNPKAVLFFSAVYSQFIHPDTSWSILALYGVTCTVIEIGWFSFVATIFTQESIRRRFLKFSHWIERTCGVVMIGLGLRLALAKVSA